MSAQGDRATVTLCLELAAKIAPEALSVDVAINDVIKIADAMLKWVEDQLAARSARDPLRMTAPEVLRGTMPKGL